MSASRGVTSVTMTISLVLGAALGGIATAHAATTSEQWSLASPSAAEPMDRSRLSQLAVGAVGFSDVSICYMYSARNCDADDFDYATSWAFPVKNKDKKQTALRVKARVTLKNSNGEELLSTLVTVAAYIPPGKTVWVAPVADSTNLDPADFDQYQAGVAGVASASARIVSASWTTKKSVPIPLAADASFDVSTSSSCWDTRLQVCVEMDSSAVVTNPGRPALVYSTWVLFDEGGKAIGGVRFLSDRPGGSSGVDYEWQLPVGVADQIVTMRNYAAPR